MAPRDDGRVAHASPPQVRDSIRRVPLSVNLLAPVVDFLAHIDNSDAAPRLKVPRAPHRATAAHAITAQPDAAPSRVPPGLPEPRLVPPQP
jgi:hypothetical protein